MKSWYQVKASAEFADVYIYDEIGAYGISAKEFISELAQYKGQPLNIHINSGGGSVFDGQSMATAIKNHGAPVTTIIEGVAASMATIIALSGDAVYMTNNSLFMIHNPMLDSYGDKNELKKAISLLEKVETNMVNAYYSKTKLPKKEIASMMNEETWFTAKEAVKAGFVDRVVDEVRVAANFDIKSFKSKSEEEILNILNGENKDKLNTTTMNDENKTWFASQFDKLANLIGSTEIPEEFTAETVVNEEVVQETTEPVVEAETTPDLSNELKKVTEERDALLQQATASEEEQLDYGKEIEAMRQRISQLEATPSTTLSNSGPNVMPPNKEEQSAWDKMAKNII
jgi:ATP-dependent protease ClpP protease subunit